MRQGRNTLAVFLGPICFWPVFAQRQYGPDRSSWFNSRGWSAPSPAYYGGNRSFGVWDGLFLWSLLNNLGRSGSGDFFHNNQNDPGYQQWRQEADRQAKDNAELRQKLDDLDRQLAERDSQPRTPGELPPDIPPEIAKAPPQRTPGVPGNAGSEWVWAVLLAGGGGIAYLAWQRRPTSKGPNVSSPPTSPHCRAPATCCGTSCPARATRRPSSASA